VLVIPVFFELVVMCVGETGTFLIVPLYELGS